MTRVLLLLGLGAIVFGLIWFAVADREGPNAPRTSPPPRETAPLPLVPTGGPGVPERIDTAPYEAPPEEPAEAPEAEASGAAEPGTLERGTLSVQLLRADGEPASRRKLHVVVSYASEAAWVTGGEVGQRTWETPAFPDRRWCQGETESQSMRCDPAGRLAVSVRAGDPGRLCLREAWLGFVPEGPPAWLAVLVFAAIEPGEVRTLPAVRSPSEPLLAEGRVVDEVGAPVSGGLLKLQPVGRLPRRIQQRVNALRVKSDEDGRFRMEADVGDREWFLWCRRFAMGESRRYRIRTGARGLAICIPTPGGLRGSFRRASGAEDLRVSLELVPQTEAPASTETGSPAPPPHQSLRTTEDGRFFGDRLVPGMYSLRLVVQGDLPHVVPGIEIRPGSISEDPRIQGILVGEGLAEGIVTVVDPSGRPVPGCSLWVTLHYPGGETARVRSGVSMGGPSVTVSYRPGGRPRVRLRARHFLPYHQEHDGFPVWVVLQPAIDLELRCNLVGPQLPYGESARLFGLVLLRKGEQLGGPKRGGDAWHFHPGFVLRKDRTSAIIEDLSPERYTLLLVPSPGSSVTSSGNRISFEYGPGFELASIDLRTASGTVSRTIDVDTLEVARFLESERETREEGEEH